MAKKFDSQKSKRGKLPDRQLNYRPESSEIPTSPGVYRFFDKHDRVIYVGKAKNLRNRINSYFRGVSKAHPRTYAMVNTGVRVDWTVVQTEREALQLEFTWIKEFDPRFNVMFRDDKSYPYLAVTKEEEVPRVFITRRKSNRKIKYFGPYTKAWAIRETLDMLLNVFPVRTCTQGVYNRAEREKRPCLLGHIGKCSAPCAGEISKEDYRKLVRDFSRFMSGKGEDMIKEKEAAMQAASDEMNFELAAKLRDQVKMLKAAFERSAIVLPHEIDADIFALAEDDLEAAAQVFYVRQGRIRGQRAWVVEKTEDLTTKGLYAELVRQAYGSDANPDIPASIWLPEIPEDEEVLLEWLRDLREGAVSFHVPQRGDKAELVKVVQDNAQEVLRLHKNKRAGDITVRSAGLQQLQEYLDMEESPLRIEGIDISHIQGTNVVGSLVVIEDGIAKKGEYRKFNVTGGAARDDTSSMYDVVKRRFQNYVDQKEKFKYPPNLLVVDGGKPQVAVAHKALEELGLTDEITVVGLAKRLEEVWRADEEFPVILPRGSEALFMLQRLRDEAHRFAITFHRTKRAKSMIDSVFDELVGIGPAKQKALLKHFGSVKRMKAASMEDLQEVSGIGKVQAEIIYSHFNSQEDGGSVVDMETGEVIDNES